MPVGGLSIEGMGIVTNTITIRKATNPLTNYHNTYIIRRVKSLKFVGSSLDDLRNFPTEARRHAGFELYAIQRGLDPSDWKPMPTIGPGVREIRIHVLGEWRVIFVAKYADTIYVLHAFRKKSQKTHREDIELARQRFRRIEE